MLSRLAKHSLKLTLQRSQMFGSGSHAVHLDKNTTWLKFRSDRRLISIDGFVDTHVQMPPPDAGEPFQHLKDHGVLSMENLVYNDPYYHEPDHELHVN